MFAESAHQEINVETPSTPSKSTFKKRATVSSIFREQLSSLLTTLSSTQAHFIRCVKPNNDKNSNFFDSQVVRNQLKYLGVLEVIRIRKSGYAIRRFFRDFCQR